MSLFCPNEIFTVSDKKISPNTAFICLKNSVSKYCCQRQCMGCCGNGRANEGGTTDLPDRSKLSTITDRCLKIQNTNSHANPQLTIHVVVCRIYLSNASSVFPNA